MSPDGGSSDGGGKVRIEIDPNVRVRGRQTYTGLEDIEGGKPVAVGDKVLAFESEAGVVFGAEVADIDYERRLIFLAVDWRSCHDDMPAGRVS